MLSTDHRALIKATVPLLETGGVALTTHFYRMMFRDCPEVRPYFNQAHQVDGSQPRALANSVLMYAKHIDRLEELGDLVSTIVNKHVALDIRPEHYDIVGSCLLKSIREVLGAEIATDAVIEAWAAAYQQLADILIGLEEKMIAQKAQAPGGWRGARAFRVTRKEKESDETTSFYLSPNDGGAAVAFEPGQFIGVRVVVDGVEMRRNYSLSAVSNEKEYRISVKREAEGRVSNYFHDQVNVGSVIDLLAPAGEFTLKASDKPLVLISGGVGITPTLAMLDAALKTERPVHFIHAARHGGVHAFRDAIDTYAQRHPQIKRFTIYSEARTGDTPPDAIGLLDAERLAQWMPATRNVDVYFLGPIGFMKSMKAHLKALGVPAAQTHYEFFGPAAALE